MALAEWTLLWIIFSVSGALLTYLAAANGGPLYDFELGRDRCGGIAIGAARLLPSRAPALAPATTA